MSKKAIDPRDLQLGRSNVKDNKELIDFYSKLEAKSTTAFWKRANDIEPWEPVTRYVPTIWRYSELRDLVLQSAELVTPEEASSGVTSSADCRTKSLNSEYLQIVGTYLVTGSQGSMSLARFQKAVVDFASSLL